MIYSIWMNGVQTVEAWDDSISVQSNVNAKVLDSIKDFGGKVCIIQLHPGKLRPPLGILDYQKSVITTETVDYQKVLERLRYFDTHTKRFPALRVLHAILGLMTETGELADILKRHLFYGEPLKVEGKGGLIEEAGDISWYLALLSDVISDLSSGVGLEVILKRNLDKLAARYKDGQFTEHRAINRNITAEENALKGTND